MHLANLFTHFAKPPREMASSTCLRKPLHTPQSNPQTPPQQSLKTQNTPEASATFPTSCPKHSPHLLSLLFFEKLKWEDSWLALKASTNAAVIKSVSNAANRQNDKKRLRKKQKIRLLSLAGTVSNEKKHVCRQVVACKTLADTQNIF